MASFRRLPSGLWQVQVCRRGVRRSDSFPSKGAAVAWAGKVESEIMAGVRGEIPNLTVRDLLERYRREVSSRKKGARPEGLRLEAVERSRLAQVRLRHLDTQHVSEWQETRLEAVSEPSVRRERNTINHAFQIAVREWRWLRKNPFDGVRRPRDSRPKNRVASGAEVAALLEHASDQLRRAIIVGLETGMRASEIASRPLIKGRVAYLADTKNGEVREVPLSQKAIAAFPVDLTAGSISGLFVRLTTTLGFPDLTFHCLRRTAATRLSKVLDPWELCAMMGWKDPRIPMKHYYSANAEAMAKKL